MVYDRPRRDSRPSQRSYSEIINELSSEEKISIIELSKSLSSNIKGNDENTFETTQRSKKKKILPFI